MRVAAELEAVAMAASDDMTAAATGNDGGVVDGAIA
jgi:hypothetical protein